MLKTRYQWICVYFGEGNKRVSGTSVRGFTIDAG